MKNRNTPRLGVVCDLLRAQVTAEKDAVVLRNASVMRGWLTDLIFVENRDTPVLGVLCDLLRARVTAEKDSMVLNIASVRVGLTDLCFVENLDIPRIRSSMWFTTRTSQCRQRLSGTQQCICEDLT